MRGTVQGVTVKYTVNFIYLWHTELSLSVGFASSETTPGRALTRKKKNSEEKTLTFRLTHAICQELSTMGALELRTSAIAFLLLRGGSSYLVPEEIRECNDASVPKGPKKYMHSRDGEGNQLT